ncbi:CDP-glucose 4,6-dehydratase [Bacillus thuringiensis]|nr:CDP-glucose 4,6-dehydratase [Bacillus thuringiensis]HDR5272146.1 CDP-glucose 4,6-dehydratase [Bacillus thuringiensis]
MEIMELTKDLSIFKGKKILVTGDTGFKGAWLCMWLDMLGADVVGYSLPPDKKDCLYNILGLEERILHIDGDILDLEHLKEVFRKQNPEFVFHLAAQPLVGVSYTEPKRTFDVNVIGSVNLLEVVRHNKSVKSVVYVTSDKCYKNKEWLWGYRENDELGGGDPYSVSKAAAELIFTAYIDAYFSEDSKIGLASARTGNVIGGGDWAEGRIIPDCVRALSAKKVIELRKPYAFRPWQHVLDVLYGYLLLSINLFHNPKKYSGSWNFGPTNTSILPVQRLVETFIDNWGNGSYNSENYNENFYESNSLSVNSEKAVYQLKWNSKWDFNRTVSETVNWYKNFEEGKDAYHFTLEQIQAYMKIHKEREVKP